MQPETSPRFKRSAFAASALVLAAPLVAALLGKSTGLSVGAFFLVPAFALAAAMLPGLQRPRAA